MKDVERITEQMRRVFEHDAWHGASVSDILKDVTAAQAASRPVPTAHSIWELVLHMISWTNEVRRRTLGTLAAEPLEGDWPSMPVPSEQAWKGAVAQLSDSHEALCRALANLPSRRLDDIVGDERDASAGTGVSYYVMMHGLIEHHAYHSGQIALLKKALS
jgi:uncharacterized damage-inducible protein DinB